MIVSVKQIQWDTDGEDVELPKEVRIPLDDGLGEDAIHDEIEKALDKVGFCHKGYQWHRER